MTPEYAAGFFDGEGCFFIRRQVMPGRTQPIYLPGAKIHHTYLPILQGFVAQWGGTIHAQKRRQLYYKENWAWSLYGDSLTRFLKETLVYLVEKRPQADTLLEYIDEKTARLSHGRLTTEEREQRERFYRLLREQKRG